MTFCTKCGAGLAPGRFCVNCGEPHPTVEADEAGFDEAGLDETAVRSAVPGPPSPIKPLLPPELVLPAREPRTGPRRRGKRKRTPVAVWLVLGILLVLVALLGSCLALVGDNDLDDGTGQTPSPSTPGTTAPTGTTGSPDPTGTGEASVNLSDMARVGSAPDPMAPSRAYGTGERVTYLATHMLDDDQETAYRLSGDASGVEIVFDLGEERTITAVGLVNGYAKTSRSGGTTIDQYASNRRVMVVEWTFADGTTVRQELTNTREPQSLQLDDRPLSDTVELRIVEVSSPGTGRYRKDSTAISAVLLLGY